MDTIKNGDYETRVIQIEGIVQGVGFRPFITKLADRWKVTGYVKNKGANVLIEVSGKYAQLNGFTNEIEKTKPKASYILNIEEKIVPYRPYEMFGIEKSEEGEAVVMISPDLPLCEVCYQELKNKKDRRWRHPFISCMVCGPRYSIIDEMPYDREHTSMVEFEMCPDCKEEYTSREDRRYHAQTISCYECGPDLLYRTKHHDQYSGEQAYAEAVRRLGEGEIIAIKGIGGYHLACTPFKQVSIKRLRQLKNREMKPFAVMFPSIDEVEKYCVVSQEEKRLLQSQPTPIVLLKRFNQEIDEEVYRESRYLGVFLPYTPLQYMLLEACGPLIMTSANLSNQPIIREDKEVEALFDKGLGGILYNERKIRVSLDDSVVVYTGKQTQLIRRSRGYAPNPIYIQGGFKRNTYKILATGGDLKASFALGYGNFLYPSEYLGDLEEEKCFENYNERLNKLKHLLKIEPEYVACDMHPQYFTTQFAKSLALPLLYIQHHHAHIASVMAEHSLKKVVGIAFDGTGYGDDGTIWGSEFLVCDELSFKRYGHLRPLLMLGGDETLKDVQKTACCYLKSIHYEDKITDTRKEILLAALSKQIQTYRTSSMGRLFDAVGSLLEIITYNDYEGQTGMLLESLAREAMDLGLKPYNIDFDISREDGKWLIEYEHALKNLIKAMEEKEDVRRLALGFHKGIATITVKVAEQIAMKEELKEIALSGGVFQNLILLETVRAMLLEKGYHVFTNEKVPPNDGGIALGQYYIANNRFAKGV